MVASTAGVKARTPKPLNNDGLSNFEQPMAEGTKVVRDFAKQGAAYSKDVTALDADDRPDHASDDAGRPVETRPVETRADRGAGD